VVLVNRNNIHWVVLLADLQRKQLVCFDPLGGNHEQQLEVLGQYIDDEVKVSKV
jgi:Ulp1 family protease